VCAQPQLQLAMIGNRPQTGGHNNSENHGNGYGNRRLPVDQRDLLTLNIRVKNGGLGIYKSFTLSCVCMGSRESDMHRPQGAGLACAHNLDR
jgi:hypothetical protein